MVHTGVKLDSLFGDEAEAQKQKIVSAVGSVFSILANAGVLDRRKSPSSQDRLADGSKGNDEDGGVADWVAPCFWIMSLDKFDAKQRKVYESDKLIKMPKSSEKSQCELFDHALRRGDLVCICDHGNVLCLVQVIDDDVDVAAAKNEQRKFEIIVEAQQGAKYPDGVLAKRDRNSTFVRVATEDFEKFYDKMLKSCFTKKDLEKILTTYGNTHVRARYWWMIARDTDWIPSFGKTLENVCVGERIYYTRYDESKAQYAFYGCREGDKIIGYVSGANKKFACSLLRCSQSLDDNKLFFIKDADIKEHVMYAKLENNAVLGKMNGLGAQGSLYAMTLEEYRAFMDLARENNPGLGEVTGNPSRNTEAPDIGRPRNLIVFGAPGTGKSYRIEKGEEKGKEGREKKFGNNYERVTFYPTYSYAQFVGTYKPVMNQIKDKEGKVEKDENGNVKEEISYEFVPGPFLRVLVNALNNPGENWCLIIEEINRANSAAVFGDVFQLLDRNSKGESEYPIAVSEDVKRFLNDEEKGLTGVGRAELQKMAGSIEQLKIPANMYIWATMNSADQGVFPMDTAFKRRWEFEYIGVDDEAEENAKCLQWTIEGCGYEWNKVRRVINGLLAVNGVNEDKLMGPYFIQPKEGNVILVDAFSSKVLMYLWEDAGRMIRRKLFENNIHTYSELVDEWKKSGIKVLKEAAKNDELKKEIKGIYDGLEKITNQNEAKQIGNNGRTDISDEISPGAKVPPES